MAFNLSNGGGTGRGRFRGSGTLSEINIVPLVDVVLVLLIIFMLTAHVMEFGLEVEVPKVRNVKDTAEELPVVTLNRDGEIYLGEVPVNINEIGTRIRERFPRMNAVYVRADKDTVWNVMAQVVSALGEAKLDVRLVTQPEDAADRPRK
jgi:biopolymer transport protein ExbD